MQRLHDQCVVMLSQDSFYRGLTEHEHQNAHSEFAVSTPVAGVWHVLALVNASHVTGSLQLAAHAHH